VARIGLLLAIVFIGVLFFPGPPVGAAHRTELPAIDGSEQGTIDIDRLPVTLVDLTGLVTSIEPNDWAVRFDDSDTAFLQLAGDPRSIRVYWLGGACASHAKAMLDEDGSGGYLLTLDEETSLGGMIGCAALGVSRRLTIRVSRTVDPLAFRLDYRN
jgi:hypothetical protein